MSLDMLLGSPQIEVAVICKYASTAESFILGTPNSLAHCYISSDGIYCGYPNLTMNAEACGYINPNIDGTHRDSEYAWTTDVEWKFHIKMVRVPPNRFQSTRKPLWIAFTDEPFKRLDPQDKL
jgi:hypothetical protein